MSNKNNEKTLFYIQNIEKELEELKKKNKQLEEELKISNSLFSDTFNFNPVAITLSDFETGSHIFVNKAYLELVGYSIEEVIGKKTSDFNIISIEDRQKILQQVQEKRGKLKQVEVKVKSRLGQFKNILCSFGPVLIGAKKGIISTMVEISDLKKTENELRESQSLFKLMFEKSPTAILISEVESGRFIRVNELFLKTFGYLEEEVIGKSSIELNFHSKEERELIAAKFKAQGYLRNQEIEFLSKDGKALIFIFSSEIIEISGKKCALTTLYNITDFKDVLRKLNEAEKIFHKIFENSPSGMVLSELETGKIIDTNIFFVKMLGFDKLEELIGYNLIELGCINPVYRNEAFEQLKMHNYTRDLEINLIRKDGKKLEVLISTQLMEFQSKQLILANIYNISERKEIERQLLIAKESAEKSQRFQEQFLANMSHEMRTPMNAIVGFADVLAKRNLKTEELGFVETIRTSSQNLISLINDILDVSKIEAGMMYFEKLPINIRELFDSIKVMFQPKVAKKQLSLQFICEKIIPKLLLGDSVRLTQIIINLVSNAIKFSAKGSILVEAKLIDDDVEFCSIKFTIKDTGIGIAKEKLKTIFDRFEQADLQTSRNYGGTGLGLNIFKQLVELQGGSVGVKSVVNRGSEFFFTLSFGKVTELDRIVSSDSTVNVNFKKMKNLKILMAEDNLVNSSLIRTLFKENNLKIQIVENGKLAVEKIKNNHYDLLLLDMEMPEINGYEATRLIREELKNHIPIIAMTANAMAGEREKCLALGMNNFISKPIHADLLFKMIYTTLYPQLKKMNAVKEPEKKKILKKKYLDVKKIDSIYNFSYLKKNMQGNVALISEIIDLSIKNISIDLPILKQAVEKKDYDNIKSYCHKLKSTCSVLGMKEGVFLLNEMESLAVLATNIEKIRSLNQQFGRICTQMIKDINAEMNK